MDDALAEILKKLGEQITALSEAERTSLHLDAHEKVLFADLYIKEGLNLGKQSVEDKKQHVYATKEWREFSKGQVEAKVKYNMAKRTYELLDKSYLAAHLTYKVESSYISRGGQ